MSLPEIPGLYDNVSTIGEIKVGSTAGYIYTANNKSMDWVFKIPTFVYNQSSCPRLDFTSGNEHAANTPSGGSDFMKNSDYWSGNKPAVLCLGNANTTAWTNYMVEPYKFKENNPNAGEQTITNNLYGMQLLNNVRPILESNTREHYIALPLITAELAGYGKINDVDMKTYKERYAESYPFITHINMYYYYKPILENTSLEQKYFSFVLPFKPNSNYMYAVPTNPGYPHYRYMYRECTIATINGNEIFHAPKISYAIPSGSQSYTYALDDQTGTHGVSYHLYPGGDLSLYQSPKLYIDLDQAINIINSMGFWWAESYASIQTEALGENTTSNNIHCPKVTAGGSTTTFDYSGSDIKKHWNETGYRPSGGISLVYTLNVNPYEEPDRSGDATEDPDPLPNESTDLEITTPQFSGVGCFSTYYAMNMAQVNHFNDDMWTSDEDWLDALILGLRFWGQNPMESIMSLRLYPFNILNYITSTDMENVKLGRNIMPTATGYVLPANSTVKLNLGSVFIRPNYNDFRDFAPYTQIQLYVPFVGFIDINANEFMNHILGIDMVVDITTGTCEACIYADSRPMVYKSGNIAVDIPISLNSMTQLSAALMQGIFNVSTSLGTAAVNQFIDSGGTDSSALRLGANGRLERVHQDAGFDPQFNISTFDIGNIAMGLSMGSSTTIQSGQSSPACNMSNTPYPYLIISYPIDEIPDNYAHTYGKVCHVSGNISNFSGFTVCRNVDATGITCTDVEQMMIKHYLETGVYL